MLDRRQFLEVTCITARLIKGDAGWRVIKEDAEVRVHICTLACHYVVADLYRQRSFYLLKFMRANFPPRSWL